MKIYTKKGDKGETSLLNGKKVQKSNIRVETYGTVDECNSVIGAALSAEIDEGLKKDLSKVSSTLFSLGSDLAAPLETPQKIQIKRISETEVVWLEKKIDEYTDALPPLKNFILPGGTSAAAHLHMARAVCRRAERLCVSLNEVSSINKVAVRFLNRLSDYLFTAARFANFKAGAEEIIWRGD